MAVSTITAVKAGLLPLPGPDSQVPTQGDATPIKVYFNQNHLDIVTVHEAKG